MRKPGAGADLDVLCLTAMHREAKRRYGSVEALIRDVDHYLNGEPLDRRKALFGANDPGVAESTVELGLLRVDQATLEEAERLVREGLNKAKGLRPPDDAAVANATVALGEVWRRGVRTRRRLRCWMTR